MSKKQSILNPKPVGTEIKVEGVLGSYATVCNWGKETAYVSCNAGVTAGADGVMPVPAGCSALIAHNGTVYILGDGDVTVVGSDEPVNFIKPVVGGGISGGTDHSNANLLINPDLSINQRGQTEYTQRNACTVDGWKLHASDGTVFNAGEKTVSIPQNNNAAWYGIVQTVENELLGKTVTLSAEVETDVDIYARITYANSTNADFTKLIPAGYNGVVTLTADIPKNAAGPFGVQLTNRNSPTAGGQYKIGWVKLEFGSVATPFVQPEPVLELLKCQRYYQVHSSGNVAEVDLRPSMYATPVITALENGNYAYSAAL